MTNTRVTRSTHELTKPGGPLDLGADARLMVGLLRHLAHGRPLTTAEADQMIAELGIDRQYGRQYLQPRTEHNASGDIVGFGLTLNPTPHRFTMDDIQMWTWCAGDTLIFPILLNRPATIESQSPVSHQTVRLQVSPHGIDQINPTSSVASWRAVAPDQVDLSSVEAIWGTFCHHSFFFPGRAEAGQWATGRDDIEILTPDEAFANARHLAAALIRHEP